MYNISVTSGILFTYAIYELISCKTKEIILYVKEKLKIHGKHDKRQEDQQKKEAKYYIENLRLSNKDYTETRE